MCVCVRVWGVGGKEGEGNINGRETFIDCLPYPPWQGTEPTTQVYALRIESVTFQCMGMVLQASEPYQPGLILF